MTRIYENPGFAKRNNISVIVLVAVVIYGIWELYTAFLTDSQDSMAAMFGVLFVGGGIYGAYTIWTEARDQVVALDADFATGRAAVTLWRPFKNIVIEATFDRLTDWRHWVKVGKRNMRTHYVIFTAEGYPQPLYVELTTGEMPEGFRKLSPAVVEEFEENTGKRPEGAAEA
ncbi:MAG TPA: hypothetical protein VFK86_16520 [Bauldia sp.]|nr:hypothetical protein [Bauldia sp.]